MNEKKKLDTIKDVIMNKISKKMAAEILFCTIRNINLLINKYNKYGYSAFIHKNRGKISNRKIDYLLENKIINLYENDYYGFNYSHFKELIEEEHNIIVSYNYIRVILLKNKLYSPRLHRLTEKNIRLELIKENNSPKINNVEKEQNLRLLLNLEKAHPMQNRKTFFGERVQADASQHYWIKGEKWHLHGMIDDATGKIIGLYFSKEETLQSYYEITKQMFLNYGLPEEILTDKRTIFWSPKEKESDMHSDSLTQFGFVCNNLGIKLTTTSVPQTKGRIERLWGTLQDRLPKLLARANINNLDQANKFALDYIEKFNNRFSLHLNNINNSFRKLENDQNIDFLLSRRFTRKINNGGTIKYMHKYYLPHSAGIPVIYKNKQDIFVVITMSNELYANTYSEWLPLVEVQQNSTYKELYEEKKHKRIPKKIKSSDAWKYSNWLMYKNAKSYF